MNSNTSPIPKNLKIILGVKRTISYLPDSLYKIAYTCRTKSKHDVILAD